jgi:hypothetical protein
VSRNKLFLVGGLLVALGLAIFVSPFADSDPDGLERVATDEGFIDSARDHSLADSPVADYSVRGVDNARVSTGLAGLIGVLITFGAGMIVFGLVKSLRPRSPSAGAGGG